MSRRAAACGDTQNMREKSAPGAFLHFRAPFDAHCSGAAAKVFR
jgi:hypothetical protein